MKEKRFKVTVSGDNFNLIGELIAYWRTPETYETRYDFERVPESYELLLGKDLLLSLLSAENPTDDQIRGHHISRGFNKSGEPNGNLYACTPNLSKERLIGTLKIWLAHQILFHLTGKDIMELRSFSGDAEFFQNARQIHEENPSMSTAEIIFHAANVSTVIEEVWSS